MAKKVAVLAVDPVNGAGLFEYLETFFENGIPYRTFAVAPSAHIMTNSGIKLTLDDVISNLKGRESEYGALVFACGDAVPKFAENAAEQYNKDLGDVMKAFASQGKLMIGHCGAGLLYETFDVAEGKRLAVHPYVIPAIKKNTAAGADFEVDGIFYTASTENTLGSLMPSLVKALKE